MVAKVDFSKDEWDTLERGLKRVAGATELMRELAGTHVGPVSV